MPDIHYRAGTEADLAPALELFFESLTDLVKRFHLVLPPMDPADWEPGYRHAFETGIFRVAEMDGKLAAHCLAIVRDDLWFLSAFWTRPSLQQQKIGQPLLKQVMNEGRERGARTFSVWSTIDPDSVACYMKQGMLPGFQILVFSGTPAAPPALPPGYSVQPLESTIAHQIDRNVRGTGRSIDHDFYLRGGESSASAKHLLSNGQPVGYYYSNNSTIGPAAWIVDEHAEAILSAAIREYSEQNRNLRIVIPGINHAAIRFVLQHGLRLKLTPHFLTTAPFGNLNRYIIGGATLF